jgi:tRNA-binding protein
MPRSDYDPAALASLEAFLSLDVRIGTVVAAEPLPGAPRPCLLLRIDFGELGPCTACTEITDLYEADELVGLQVVGVVNLPAERIAGHDAEVVVLAVSNSRGERTLLIPERPVPDGARIAP